MVINPNLIKGGGDLDGKTRLINDTIFFMCNGPLKVYMLFIFLKWFLSGRMCNILADCAGCIGCWLLLQRPSKKKRLGTSLKSRRCSWVCPTVATVFTQFSDAPAFQICISWAIIILKPSCKQNRPFQCQGICLGFKTPPQKTKKNQRD